MLTYLIIGLIVQAMIMIERAVRVPEYWSVIDFKDWKTYVSITVAIIINVVAWPLSIIMEGWLVIHGI